MNLPPSPKPSGTCPFASRPDVLLDCTFPAHIPNPILLPWTLSSPAVTFTFISSVVWTLHYFPSTHHPHFSTQQKRERDAKHDFDRLPFANRVLSPPDHLFLQSNLRHASQSSTSASALHHTEKTFCLYIVHDSIALLLLARHLCNNSLEICYDHQNDFQSELDELTHWQLQRSHRGSDHRYRMENMMDSPLVEGAPLEHKDIAGGPIARKVSLLESLKLDVGLQNHADCDWRPSCRPPVCLSQRLARPHPTRLTSPTCAAFLPHQALLPAATTEARLLPTPSLPPASLAARSSIA